MIGSFKGNKPNIHSSDFVEKNADIICDGTNEEDSSVWFQTVIRGDVAPTHIGKRVNIQDLSLVHQSPNAPVIVEDDVTMGHQVTLHGCTVRKNALIGMGSLILDNVEIGENAFIDAGSVVSSGKVIPTNKMTLVRTTRVNRA